MTLLGAVALCVLVWLLGPYIAIAGVAPFESLAARIVATLFILGVGGLVVGMMILRRRKANAGLVSGMLGDSAGDMARDEAGRLRERFEEAVRTLKESRGRDGRISLYDLPWYIIIGPPGAGKTTVLSNSGLRFPLAARFGNKAVRGVGGTRNCDWWFTDNAVFLDTAGRYTTQDSNESVDREGWRNFLDLLKRHRRRRPINGVMIAISLADVLTLDPQQRNEHVSAIRKRLNELHRHFGIRFPVYVLLTKCDLVPGFIDFFEDLSTAEERAQVWGFTLELEQSRALDNLDEIVDKEFAELVNRLQARTLHRVYAERDVQRRAAIFTFPEQMAAAMESARAFVHDAFAPSTFEEPAFLRGVYLTSGTQEGAPIDRLVGRLARGFGLEAALSEDRRGQGRSYFITRLLLDVMFPESGLSSVDRRFERQLRWAQNGAYVAALALTVLAVTAWSVSFAMNRGYLDEVGTTLARYTEVKEGEKGEPQAHLTAGAPRLAAARAVAELTAKRDADIPLAMRFGLYQGGYLADAARDGYAREVEHQLMPRVRHALETELTNPARDVYQVYELLRVYLMLGDPKRLQKADIVRAAKLLAQNQPANDPSALPQLLADLEQGLGGEEPPAQAISLEIVARARQRLAALPLEEFVLNRIRADSENAGQPPLRLQDIIGARGVSLVSRRSGGDLDISIPALYTRKGYYEVFLVQSARAVAILADEHWVLGDSGSTLHQLELAALPGKLAKLYELQYAKVWQDLINDLQIVRLRGVADAADKLLVLAGAESPIRLIMTALANNVSIAALPTAPAGVEPGAVADLAAKASAAANRLDAVLGGSAAAPGAGIAPGPQIEMQFRALLDFVRSPAGGPGRMDGLLGMLGQVQQELSSTGSGLGKQTAAAVVVRGDMARSLELEAQQLPAPVRQWVQQLAQDIRGAVVGGAAAEVKDQLNTQVGQSCGQLVAGRYPFERASKDDVKLADFSRVFAQGGLLDQFFTTNLAQMVDTSVKPWRWKSTGGAALGLSNDSISQFERAAAIRDTFFGPGAQAPRIEFDIKVVELTPDLAQVQLVIDGQAIVYRHGPVIAQRMQWPGAGGVSEVRIVFTGLDQRMTSRSFEGPWAFYRFLDELGQPGASADRLNIPVGIGQSGALFELVAGSAINPLRTELLSGFHCPGGT